MPFEDLHGIVKLITKIIYPLNSVHWVRPRLSTAQTVAVAKLSVFHFSGFCIIVHHEVAFASLVI